MCKNCTNLCVFLSRVTGQSRFKAWRKMLSFEARATKSHYKVMGIEMENLGAIFAIYYMPFDHNLNPFFFQVYRFSKLGNPWTNSILFFLPTPPGFFWIHSRKCERPSDWLKTAAVCHQARTLHVHSYQQARREVQHCEGCGHCQCSR